MKVMDKYQILRSRVRPTQMWGVDSLRQTVSKTEAFED